ncbi:serine hydrolase domain-containing protein [Sphaerotilus microaerophilus]|uniref:6-aminohexanoate-dimer hydrolase n=1 Tax=Sphaerotilus microaerophilus TaxID=2914710 RepID=A0ABN6PM48_9BURK|nr:serine hydrolase [Sphaerotilus sp. FB-5]BDI06249.1 6-aminohexanoate-dimer hydrolase [Sphaerotilus sp. FB-5]
MPPSQTRLRLHTRLMYGAAALLLALPALAQTGTPAPLDPARLMQGFPPPPEYRVTIANWQQNPQKVWSFRHARELFPTRPLQPTGVVRELPVSSRDSLSQFQAGPPESQQTWPQMLASTHVDAALVLHRGRIIDERYFKGMQAQEPHLMFSATKSMVGLMAATLIAEGRLDENARVGSILPELAASAWADATVRQVLDMTDGVRFTEIYTDPTSDIFPYIASMGWIPVQHRRADSPFGIQAMLPTLKRMEPGERGSAFRYRSPATDVVAWIAARSAGQSLSDWLQQRLWSRLGMEHQGNVMLDPEGTEVAFAGMSASARDLGRIGQMLLQRGRWDGQQIIPEQVVDQLIRGGSTEAFKAAGMEKFRPGWSYRDQWWVNPQAPRSFAAMGAYGQRLYVFPDDELVVVLLSSHPQPIAALVDVPQLVALRRLTEVLRAQR